jgi:hypothetical protein
MLSWDPGIQQFGLVPQPLPIRAANEAKRPYTTLCVAWVHRWPRLVKHVNLCRVIERWNAGWRRSSAPMSKGVAASLAKMRRRPSAP